jgi:hypothetical protein
MSERSFQIIPLTDPAPAISDLLLLLRMRPFVHSDFFHLHSFIHFLHFFISFITFIPFILFFRRSNLHIKQQYPTNGEIWHKREVAGRQAAAVTAAATCYWPCSPCWLSSWPLTATSVFPQARRHPKNSEPTSKFHRIGECFFTIVYFILVLCFTGSGRGRPLDSTASIPCIQQCLWKVLYGVSLI